MPRAIEDHPVKWIVSAIVVAVLGASAGPEAVSAVAGRWHQPRAEGATPGERMVAMETKLDAALAGISELKGKLEAAADESVMRYEFESYAADQRELNARQDAAIDELEDRFLELQGVK